MLFSGSGLFLEDILFTVSLQNLIISEFRNPKSFAVRLYVDASMNGLQIPRSQNHKKTLVTHRAFYLNTKLKKKHMERRKQLIKCT